MTERAMAVFDILGWWHAGTGRGDGPIADAVLARSSCGLPYIPGRTVKGLIRDAVSLGVLAGVAQSDQVVDWFGTDLVEGDPENRERRLEEARFLTRPGRLRFESATLGSEWDLWAAANPIERELLVSHFASTRMGDDGVASDQTLRTIEVAVPMCLRAEISGLDEEAAGVISAVLPLFLRGVGSHRHRGLGRVSARLEVM